MTMMPKRSSTFTAALAALVAAALLQACAGGPTKAYSGPDRPAAEVATIRCGFSVGVVAIDDDSSFKGRPLECAFAVLPGRHRVRYQIHERQIGVGTFIYKKEQEVAFDVKAGQAYDISALAESPGQWTVVVVNSTTKEWVIHPRLKPAR